MRTRVRLCSAGFAYFSNDQFSKLMLILQKMLLGFTQLVAIKGLCWVDYLSVCFSFYYIQLSNLGRCWIAALAIAFNFHCRCCIPLLEEWYIFRSVVSRSVFIKAGSGRSGWNNPSRLLLSHFCSQGPILRAAHPWEQFGILLSEESHWRKQASMNEGKGLQHSLSHGLGDTLPGLQPVTEAVFPLMLR